MVDIASVGGLVELRRLRPGCGWPVFVRRWHDAAGKSQGPTDPRPIEPGDAASAPLLREFCEPAAVDVERVEVEPGLVEYVLPAGPVGRVGTVTCLVGEIFDAVGSAHATPSDEHVDFNTRVGTPTERLVIDTLVHRDLASLGTPRLLLRNEIQRVFRGRQVWTDADTLEPLASVQVLGRGHAAMGIVDAPWYAQMACRTIDALGESADAFEIHRVSIPHPPLGATATVRYTLPTDGQG